jgi:hypothetical protein
MGDTMKYFAALVILFFALPAHADQYVHGYTRSDGTYVNGYYRSSPNGTVTDNYSYRGNENPYTGSAGTNSYQHDTTSPYFNGTPYSNGQYGHPNNLNGSYGQQGNGLFGQ